MAIVVHVAIATALGSIWAIARRYFGSKNTWFENFAVFIGGYLVAVLLSKWHA